MTSPTIELASSTDRVEWNRFLDEYPASTYCHRWEWREVFESAYDKPCFYLYASEEGRWTGVLPLVHMKGRLAGNCLVSMPFLDQGGILATSEASRLKLGDAAFELLSEVRAGSLDLRGGGSETGDGPEATNRFRFLLPLLSPEEALWKSVGSKVRNQIRKSRREGLTTYPAAADELGRFYAVFARNMRDLGSPVHSEKLFREVLSLFGSKARLYLTSASSGRIVAGGIAIRFKDTVVVPWASSLRSARSACPNHSMYWRILRDAAVERANLFDFGRSSIGSGTFQFKKQWGGIPEPLVWTFFDRHKQVQAEPYLSPGRNARLAKLWMHLPTSLANRLGPFIRRQLPN